MYINLFILMFATLTLAFAGCNASPTKGSGNESTTTNNDGKRPSEETEEQPDIYIGETDTVKVSVSEDGFFGIEVGNVAADISLARNNMGAFDGVVIGDPVNVTIKDTTSDSVVTRSSVKKDIKITITVTLTNPPANITSSDLSFVIITGANQQSVGLALSISDNGDGTFDVVLGTRETDFRVGIYYTTDKPAGSADPMDFSYAGNAESWFKLANSGLPDGFVTNTGIKALWVGKGFLVYKSRGANFGGRLFDPESKTWSSIGTTNQPSERYDHAEVYAGGKYMVFGGTAPSGTESYNTGAQYDPETDEWSPMSTTNAPTDRSKCVAVAMDDRVFLFGQELIISVS